MSAKYRYFIILFFMCLCINAQHRFSTYTAHHSIVEAIRVSKNIIQARTADFEKKAIDKPLMFLDVKKKIGELNKVSNSLSLYIEKLQDEVNTERILYDLLGSYFYKKILFTGQGSLTPRGNKMKVKIDSLYQLSSKINVHKLTGLKDFANSHFKTNRDYYNDEEEKIDYFNYLFYDKSNYGIMMSLNYLLLDVKTFQLIYFGTVMSY